MDLLFNINILVNNINKYQYNLPLKDNPNGTGRRISIINFKNTKGRKIIDNAYSLIYLLYNNIEIKTNFKLSISHYKTVFEILRKKEGEYNKEEKYKCDINIFYAIMVKKYGR